jgi:hypothetical protein
MQGSVYWKIRSMFRYQSLALWIKKKGKIVRGNYISEKQRKKKDETKMQRLRTEKGCIRESKLASSQDGKISLWDRWWSN